MKQRSFIGCGLAIASLLLTGSLLLPLSAQTQSADDAAEAALTPRLKQVLNVMRIARARHLLKPENPEMIAGAIRGMLARLDPEAELYTPADMERLGFSTGNAKSFGSAMVLQMGLGIHVRKLAMPQRSTGPAYQIVSTIDGSPAARAGLHEGDLIASINGILTSESLSFDLGVNTRPGNRQLVDLSILRGTSSAPIEVVLSHEDSRSVSAVATPLPMGLLLLRGRFGPVAASDIELSVGAALRSANAALSGLILDLRDTSGGSIDQAIQIADAFLEAGIITTLETRGAAAITHRARSGDIAGGKPIVVLINAGTTSAAEILAAALQDNKRATLIGSKSAGLGSTSTFVPLAGNRGAIRMKTGRYLTPSGRPLDKSGIKPDIEIKPAKDDAASACREVDMPAENGDGQCERRPVRDDPVLQAAIAHLTGLAASAKP